MGISHLKTSELEPKLQKYEGRVVLRGGIVKDDSGANAVFSEQGSSASNSGSKKRLWMSLQNYQPDCDGQAAHAVSAYTQVKNGGPSKIGQNFRVRVS